jgi:hypothetical protein
VIPVSTDAVVCSARDIVAKPPCLMANPSTAGWSPWWNRSPAMGARAVLASTWGLPTGPGPLHCPCHRGPVLRRSDRGDIGPGLGRAHRDPSGCQPLAVAGHLSRDHLPPCGHPAVQHLRRRSGSSPPAVVQGADRSAAAPVPGEPTGPLTAIPCYHGLPTIRGGRRT